MVKNFSQESQYESPWTACVRAYFLRYPNPYASHVISVDVLDRSIIHRASPSPSSPLDPSSSRSATSGDTTGTTDGAFILRTTRLILKRGTLPKWAPKGLIKNAESWVLEESEVELDAPFSEAQLADSDAVQEGRKMCTWTRNLDHTTVLAVTEGLVLQERIAKGSRPSDRGSSFEKGKGQEVLSSNATAPTTSNPLPASDSPNSASAFAPTACLTTAQISSALGFGMLRRRIEKFGLARFEAHKDTSRQGILWSISQLSPGHAIPTEPASPDPTRPTTRRWLLGLLTPSLDGVPIGPIQRLRTWLFTARREAAQRVAEIQTRLLLHPSSSSSKLLDQTQIQANELNQTGHEREGRPRGLIRRLRTRFGWEISDEGGQEART